MRDLAGLHVFVERLADCTGTGVELLDIALDLFAEACLIEVEAEDILAAVELAQGAPVLIGLANLEGSDDGLQLGEHGVWRRLKRSEVVFQSLQVAGIACQREGDEHEVRHVEAASHILLDGLTEADGELLGGVHGDALRSVGHEGVRQTAVDDGTDELVGVEHARIGDDGHCLHITDLLDEGAQVFVGHLGRDEGVAQHAAVDGHRRVEWVETGGDLHGLYLIDGLARGVEGTAEVEWGTTVGVVVLDDEVLHLFGIHEGSGEGVALGLDVVVVVEAVGSEHLLDLLMRTRGDLVDHRPGEGDLLLVLQVVEEGGGHESVVDPALGIGEDASLDLVAIVRAVVHRLYGEGQLSGLPALVEQCADLTHGEEWLHAACEVGLVEAVALLGDGEGDHLQARVAEDLDEALPVGELGIGLEGLGDAGDDLLLDGACRLEADEQGEVVIGGVGLVDDLEVEGLGDDDATIVLACVQGVVEDGSGEGTEDVASAEVYPCRFLGRLLAHGLDIEFGELVALGFPLSGIIITAKYII